LPQRTEDIKQFLAWMNYTSKNINPSLAITRFKTIGVPILYIFILLSLSVLSIPQLWFHAPGSELSFEQDNSAHE
jgi:hypothetical protein